MPSGIFNQEWGNSNEQRSFPLAQQATGKDVTGSFVLPQDFLVGLYFPIPFDSLVNPDAFFVRAIAAYATGYTVSIAYDDGSADPPVVASATVSRDVHNEYDPYPLIGEGDYAACTGKIVVGLLSSIDEQPVGIFYFDRVGGLLDPDCILPMIRGVDSLVVVNGGERSDPLYNVIDLIAGTNVKLTVKGNGIRFDAAEGAGLTETCVCDNASGSTGDPIRTINGVGPDENGNFRLTGNKCLKIEPSSFGLVIRDTCSEPCCGCPELTKLTEELSHVRNEIRTLDNRTTELDSRVTQFADVVFSSKVPGSCTTC